LRLQISGRRFGDAIDDVALSVNDRITFEDTVLDGAVDTGTVLFR